TSVSQLIAQYAPDEIVFEELFFGKNITTAMLVGAARGVALCACADSGLPMYEYTPMQVKLAVTGFGNADETQVQ
ncbi:MAG: crossover junction endodeoxyribonuclease RuvC, partial [Clostridiales bacterium]|nr:crossover junction endodeoxyribonuclease RuvC [Clostridiales bacterium]